MLSDRRFAMVRRMPVSGIAVPGVTDGTGIAGRFRGAVPSPGRSAAGAVGAGT